MNDKIKKIIIGIVLTIAIILICITVKTEDLNLFLSVAFIVGFPLFIQIHIQGEQR